MNVLGDICDMVVSPWIWIPIWRRGRRNTSQISLWRMLSRVLIRLLILIGVRVLIQTLILIGVGWGLRLILIRILVGILHRLSRNIVIIVPLITVRCFMTIPMTDLALLRKKDVYQMDVKQIVISRTIVKKDVTRSLRSCRFFTRTME